MRIVLGSTRLASYQQGGGHWAWFLQYVFGLRALGHDIFWLELVVSRGDREGEARMIASFFERVAACGLADRAAVLTFAGTLDVQRLDQAEIFGMSRPAVADVVRTADLLLNFSCAVRPPLLTMFRRRALLDFDPGHLQVSAETWDLGFREHDVLLTIGARIGAPDCPVPTGGFTWRKFEPLLYLPMWQAAPDPGPDAPFTSVTQWTWEELPWRGELISVSKRTAYLEYAELPRLARRPFELAVNIGPTDPAGDHARLEAHGWTVSDPHQVSATPEAYQAFIRRSRAEFMCGKPIHALLRTGWFSDRSIAYLASGRPVLAQETGFSERLPTGLGLVAFRDMHEALEGVADIDARYPQHARAARELAEALFDSRTRLPALLAACEA